jgi:hypothetical protein
MAQWWSIEVLHGEFSAFRWQEQHDSALIEAALTNGALDGSWHADRWGVVFEVCFENEEQWETFRALPAVRAALDGTADSIDACVVLLAEPGDRILTSDPDDLTRLAVAAGNHAVIITC